tara:strand:+ start:445 stop:1293 length:849 start_codon:yes stop_codon:yes gene_type:complete
MLVKSPIISASDLYQNISRNDIRIIDTRFSLFNKNEGRSLYEKNHIIGASYADLDKDLAGNITESSGRHPLPDIDAISGRLRQWGINKSTHVIAYDHNNGSIASRLWWLLKWLGHKKVYVLDGGYLEWEKNNFPIDNSSPNYESGNFSPVMIKEKIWTAELINTWIQQSTYFLLIDARDESRFRGIEEPIDKVAGHIPGTLNIPFTLFLEKNGIWKKPKEIKAIWKKYQINNSVEWAVMCGSGVTACHLSISAALAGLSAPKLYPGSWSEWISDNNRPIVNE